MKRACAIIIAAVLELACSMTMANTASSGNITIAGKSYIRLTDWAKAKGFQIQWLKRDESLQLSNRSGRVTLGVDSREAAINGVQVRLLFPLMAREGVPYLAQLDAVTTLQPLLFPPASPSRNTLRSICLDPGHGGKDPGNQISGKQEKKYTLLLAQELQSQLGKAGLKVTMTRTTDSFIELPSRPDIARRRGADLFVSIHFNAFSQKSVRGAEVYCLTPAGAPSTNAQGEGGGAGLFPGNRHNDKNIILAYEIQKSLTRNLGVEDRGVHRARFAVLRDAEMPAVLVEGGFMSNPGEGAKIFNGDYRKQMAKAIAEAILSYKRLLTTAPS